MVSHFAHFPELIAIFVGLGHSVLAMSGEESLAQVYREIEHPKLPNLKKTGLVIFIYSLVFTSLVSFFRGDDHSGSACGRTSWRT